MEYGEIDRFDVTASCPHCTEVTEVLQGELRSNEVTCQHCDEIFTVILDD
jgi:uncharacterized Zn finger protein